MPEREDRKLFEMLILEGAQAGLSWRTVLGRRHGYLEVFQGLDPVHCAGLTEPELEEVLQDERIIRNRLKVYSVVKNARAFLQIVEEHGSFSNYLWSYVDGQPVINEHKSIDDVPAMSDLSDQISKDLKKRGMSFVGSTIIYAYLQAVGVVNDHTVDCWRNQAA